MRTALDLPQYLLDEAMELTRIRSKTKVIITALEELIRKARISEVKIYRGKVKMDIDLGTLRGRQRSSELGTNWKD